ncbi:type VI secretion system lipoprotein TssJ [Campylobacter sp. CCUG 57310]|uniref:type VI secretion system lipoprotein TssJ n=1 Tax=Campylobacter sp. CCUG 57310 TaxID=2517362 RepID=UPI001563754D|nr:type VI secretion system lipoprotein TssJ [Campylobacter sp. CCUG 57310]QKF91460.1 type VI secretion system, membrane platform protein [Campylobacter sp. CCUG 57310]
MIKKVILSVFVALFFSACGKLSVGVNNTPNSNFNHRGDNVPITVILYQLKDIKKFQEATEMELLEREDEILGRDKIDSIKLQIEPEADVSILNIDKQEVPYVGILVLYADQNKTKIKEFKKTAEIKSDYLVFKITDKDIKALGAKSLSVKINQKAK